MSASSTGRVKRRGLSFYRLFFFSSSSIMGTAYSYTLVYSFVRAARRGVYYRLSPFDDRYVIPAQVASFYCDLRRCIYSRIMKHLRENARSDDFEFRLPHPRARTRLSSIRAIFSRTDFFSPTSRNLEKNRTPPL